MSNTPNVRFSKYTDSWKQNKLSEFGKATGGTSIESEFVDNGDYKVISIGSYSDMSKYTDQGLRANKTSKTEGRILNKGDLTMVLNDKTSSGNIIGRVLLIDTDNAYVYNQRTERIEVYKNDFEPEFLYFLLNADKVRKQIIGSAQGNTQIYVNWTTISKLKYYIPKEKDEQQKIAKLLRILDNLIIFQQREYEKLVALKAACLDKMLPKKSSKVPEVRFSGFAGDWESYRLGRIGKTYTGLSGKTKEDFGHGEGKFVTYMNVYSNPVSDLERTEPIEIDASQNVVQYGDVFFTTSSETPEEVGMSSVWLGNSDNVYLNSFCFGFRPTIEIDPLYMAYMLRSEVVRKKISYLAQGISRYNISKNRVMEIKVPVPDLDEQKLIGAFFTNLDKLISLQNRKVEKLKQLKQSMLHNMFV